jgi:signal transduction histidine kinase
VAAGFLVYLFCTAWLLDRAFYNDFWYIFWLLGNVAVLFALCWWTVCFARLRKGSQAIAAGDLNHQIDTSRMPHDLKAHAEDLNNITQGLQNAVNEQMRSERFKAELITNVSHDLKTPLTSIINYVDLLKKEDIPNETARGSIEVLDRKSQRLKKLTEDLVEASKASTGALTVNRERLDVKQLVEQAAGEYQEKLTAAGLTLVTTLPQEPVSVTADGRHLWRVLDNLLGNCVKYALEGTRVYLDVTAQGEQVVLTVKNISRQSLNLPAQQLMERFVRGDESRTTQGSGLGLSIARSLTELQGGTFELTIDGDLFKAAITLPLAQP